MKIETPSTVCKWLYVLEEEAETFETDCGSKFEYIDHPIDEWGYKHCPKCGRPFVLIYEGRDRDLILDDIIDCFYGHTRHDIIWNDIITIKDELEKIIWEEDNE